MSGEDIDWDKLVQMIKPARKKKPAPKRKVQLSAKQPRSGTPLKRHYKAGYNTTKLENLMARRGEKNAQNIVLQRGKTLVTRKTGDNERAQVATQKTFDGMDIVDNFIAYDKNMIQEPQNKSLAAQFGNYQEQQVRLHAGDGDGHVSYVTRRPCPI